MAHSHYCVKRNLWLNAIMQDRKPQDQDKFIIRLPNGMRERIKAAADANNRSMNAEIVATLRETYPEPDLDEATRELLEKFEALPDIAKSMFLKQYLSKVSPEDIENGIVPGVNSVAKETKPAPEQHRGLRPSTGKRLLDLGPSPLSDLE